MAYTILVTGWIAYENLYTYGQISFPWLTLGNGFAIDVKLIQWYEYTGVFGGSLWVWICNLLIFNALKHKKQLTAWIAPAAALVLPAVVSLIMYYSYKEPSETVSVSLIQPNFDPYTEKFNGNLQNQHRILLNMMRECPPGTDFIVAPETALHEHPWEDRMEEAYMPREIRYAIDDTNPGATVICGDITWRRYANRDVASPTARTKDGLDFWYDHYNSALIVDTTDRVGISHKSKLVAGAETMPYPRIFSKLDFLTVKLGGTTSQYGMDSIRMVFTTPQNIRHATAICYESIYGEYFTEFVRNGAEVMFVITNDGWWKDTPGYRQHFTYSRLRAVENRRSIGRSANTGISGLIDQRGDVVQKLGWNVRGTVSGDLHLNDRLTFYTRYGDIIGRIAGYVFILCLLYFMAYRVRRKSHLVE